jgi:hypothetical protein
MANEKKFDWNGPYAIKAADNLKVVAELKTGDRRRITIYLKAMDGEKFIEIVEENLSKKTGTWYLISHIKIPMIKYGVESTIEPLGPFMEAINKAAEELEDFEIDGNVHYFLYGPKNEKGKHDYEGMTTDIGDRQVKSR